MYHNDYSYDCYCDHNVQQNCEQVEVDAEVRELRLRVREVESQLEVDSSSSS